MKGLGFRFFQGLRVWDFKVPVLRDLHGFFKGCMALGFEVLALGFRRFGVRAFVFRALVLYGFGFRV